MYKLALERSPNDKVILNSIGGVYEKLGDLQNALEYFDKVIVLDSSFKAAFYNKGLVLMKKKEI